MRASFDELTNPENFLKHTYLDIVVMISTKKPTNVTVCSYGRVRIRELSSKRDDWKTTKRIYVSPDMLSAKWKALAKCGESKQLHVEM